MTKLLLVLVVICLVILSGLAIYDSYRSTQAPQGETGDDESETTA